MHTRRLASLLIGAWLAASILMDFVVITNFRQVDVFLSAPSPAAAEEIHTIGGKTPARVFLRHEVGELNRYLFEQWEYAQIVLGIAVLGVLIFGHGEAPKIVVSLAGLMLVIVLIDRFGLTPQITRLGRLDQTGSLFWSLHGMYSGLELLKIALGLGAAVTLLVRFQDREKFVREHERLTKAGLQRG